MNAEGKLLAAFEDISEAKENTDATWVEAEEIEDDFQTDIKDTAKELLVAIKSAATGKYALEAMELAKLTKAVCDLQDTFYGKEDKAQGNIIMTNQLAVFKGMI